MSDWVEEVMPEIPDYIVNGTEIVLDKERDLYAEWVECPECNIAFAIDSTYLDQVDNRVACPNCRMVLEFEEKLK